MKSVVFDRGFIYPSIIFVMVLPMCFFRVLDAYEKKCETGFVASMSYSVFVLHGFINAVVFFANRSVRETLKKSEDEGEEIGSLKSSLCITYDSFAV